MALDQLKQIMESVSTRARVDMVFGESREIAGKTIIPVAKVAYCGGACSGGEKIGEGGGLGVRACPLGVLVITEGAERWRPVVDKTRTIMACSLVAIVGLLTLKAVLSRRR
jgi:uncharacterized spore protein YtfJ